MIKRKKFLSVFAILFALLFAVGLVFGSACKKDKDEEEHVHSYDTGVVTKEATCTEDGVMTYTCVDGDDSYTETIPATGHSYGEWDGTAATCTADANRSRTCAVCGDVEKDDTKATGHKYVVEFGDWTGDEENGYTTTVTVTCSNDSSENFVEDTDYTVSITSDDNVYTATVKDMEGIVIGEDSYTAEGGAELPDGRDEPASPENPTKITIDFSQEDTYSWIPTEEITYTSSSSTKTYPKGIANGQQIQYGYITLASSAGSDAPMSIGTEKGNTLNTAGETKNSSRYFKIAPSDYMEKYISIEVEFVSNAGSTSSSQARSLAITSNVVKPENNNWLELETSVNNSDIKTLNYSYEISEGTELYVTWDASVNISKISISITDDNPNTGSTEPEPEGDVISIASESVEAGEGITAFVNSGDLTLEASEGENSYVVTGTASVMDASQAGWYNTSDCVEGDYYIVLYIAANGATVSYNGKTFENEDEIYVIVRVAGEGDATITHDSTVFTVDGTSYTVSYSGITLPSVETSGPKAEAETRVTATIENVDNFNGASFTNQTDVSFVFDHTQSGTEWGTDYNWVWMKAEGTASEMSATQAAAFDPESPSAHDSYVIITVTIHAGEKMVYSQGTKSVDNTNGTSDIEEVR